MIYIVTYDLSQPGQNYDKYKTALDSNDQLYVGAVSRPAAWIGMPDDVTEWIKKKL